MSLQSDHPDDYTAALHLIDHGVPIFLAKRSKTFPTGGSGDTGYKLPGDWQTTRPDPSILQRWQPGMALCAVMGHTVDGLDVDTNKGGSLPPDLIPVSYGQALTPSGGTHDLIAPLGMRSRDGLLPGVDFKGGVSGLGHGFLFLAPTEKLSKVTGQVGQYRWATTPDLGMLDLIGTDTSGRPLAEHISEAREGTSDGRPAYDGPSYPDLSDQRREAADRYLEDTIFEWRVRLGDASGWEENITDHLGRGWERLSRDSAWAIARIAVCPWTGLDEDRARDLWESIMPAVMLADPKCRKWYEGILEKAAARPADQPPWWSEVFFEQTPVLAKIEQAAISTMNVPQGMLAVTLGRVLAEVPPWVMLPPLSHGGDGGSKAGLNLGIALVAPSGGGKSSAMKASRGLLGIVGMDQRDIEEGAGSGEGLIDMFLEQEREPDPKDETKTKGTGRWIIKDDPRVIYNIDEIEQMAAVGTDRQGSTLNSTMRTALTGGALKTSNTRAGGRYRAVPEDSYRLVVMAGVQPMRSDVLLSAREESVGTPQRFLWAKMTDKSLTLPDHLPPWPESINWEPPTEWPEVIEYPEHIREEFLAQRRRQMREEVDSTEGHTMLTRLKVAFALAVLHGSTKITDQWWLMAGILIDQSRKVQSECKQIMGEANQEREIHRATRMAKAQVVAEKVAADDRLGDCVRAVVNRLQKDPGVEFSWNQIKPAHRLRSAFETAEIVEACAKAGVRVTERESGGRTAYHLKWTEQ